MNKWRLALLLSELEPKEIKSTDSPESFIRGHYAKNGVITLDFSCF